MQSLYRLFTLPLTRIAFVACIVNIMLPTVMPAEAQGLFSEQAVLVPSQSDDVRRVSIDGNVALVQSITSDPTGASVFLAHVFERDPATAMWYEITTLTTGGPSAPPGAMYVDISGDTALVADGTTAYIFERNQGGPNMWGLVITLSGEEPGTLYDACCGVAIDGDTAVVPSSLVGGVYVFERNRGGPNAWGRVATLRAADADKIAFFGYESVAISTDTIVVGALEPPDPGIPQFPIDFGARKKVYIFDRHQGGANAWGQVTTLSLTQAPGEFFAQSPPVAIEGGTVVVGIRTSIPGSNDPSPFSNSAQIFDRDQGGPNAWGRVASLGLTDRPGFFGLTVAIAGGIVVATANATGLEVVHAYARNQGGTSRWGRVSTLTPGNGSLQGVTDVAIGGDTALTSYHATSGVVGGAVPVFVSDVDGDGLRDGVDACPRDPLNNIAGNCRRSTTSAPVVDNLLALSNLATASKNGDYHVTATFTNTSQSAIRNPFFAVTELSGGNLLKNADGGPGGAGATLSADVGNGVLEPGESTRVTFVIKLATRNRFRFLVNVRGNVQP